MREEIKLGQKVECMVTGAKGIVVSISWWLNNCRRMEVQSPLKEDGTIPDAYHIDEVQLKIIDKDSGVNVLPAEKQTVFLGNKVEHEITGLVGVAVGRSVYLNGCAGIAIEPRVDDKGKYVHASWFKEPQVKVLTTKKESEVKKEEQRSRTGGPMPKINKSQIGNR